MWWWWLVLVSAGIEIAGQLKNPDRGRSVRILNDDPSSVDGSVVVLLARGDLPGDFSESGVSDLNDQIPGKRLVVVSKVSWLLHLTGSGWCWWWSDLSDPLFVLVQCGGGPGRQVQEPIASGRPVNG